MITLQQLVQNVVNLAGLQTSNEIERTKQNQLNLWFTSSGVSYGNVILDSGDDRESVLEDGWHVGSYPLQRLAEVYKVAMLPIYMEAIPNDYQYWGQIQRDGMVHGRFPWSV